MNKQCNRPPEFDIDIDDFSQVANLIDKISKKLFRVYNEFITSIGITPQQYYLLSHLWDNDGIPLNELAKVHGTAKSTITGIVDTMERNGLVVRDRDSSDRRVILVKLTEQGRKMQDQSVDLNAILNKCCIGMTRVEIKQLKDLLSKFDAQVRLSTGKNEHWK